jgi:ribosomal protein S25
MSNIFPHTLFALLLLLSSIAKSEEATTDKSAVDASSASKTDSAAGAQPPAASDSGSAAPNGGNAIGAAASSTPEGSAQSNAQSSEQGDKAGNDTKSTSNQESSQPPTAQPTPPAAAGNPASNSASEPVKPQTESAQSAEQPKAPDSAASEALKASKEEQEKQKESVKEVVHQEGGVISGKFELDVTESYSHLTSNQLYIDGFGILPIVVVGDVNVQNVRKDIFNTTVTANYKLTDKMQVSLSVPYQQTITRVSNATGITGKNVVSASDEKVTQTSDLGDISGSINYTLMDERVGRPSLYGGLSLKARNGRDVFETPDPAAKPPPGSGFYSVRGSLSVSKSSAPAVIFGSLGYAYNFKRNNILYTPKGKDPILISSYEPGANVSLSAGVALSINYDLSLNFSFAQSFSYTSRINGNVLANSASNAITFRMGGIWRVNDKTSIDLSVTQGLSPDAPGFTLAIRVPWRF